MANFPPKGKPTLHAEEPGQAAGDGLLEQPNNTRSRARRKWSTDENKDVGEKRLTAQYDPKKEMVY